MLFFEKCAKYIFLKTIKAIYLQSKKLRLSYNYNLKRNDQS